MKWWNWVLLICVCLVWRQTMRRAFILYILIGFNAMEAIISHTFKCDKYTITIWVLSLYNFNLDCSPIIAICCCCNSIVNSPHPFSALFNQFIRKINWTPNRWAPCQIVKKGIWKILCCLFAFTVVFFCQR